MSASKFPKFIPEEQTLKNYLELMRVVFNSADISDDTKKVGIILTHIPTIYFDYLVSLFACNSPSDLSLDDLKTSLTALFNPPVLPLEE